MRTVRPMSWLPLAAVLAVSSPVWAAEEEKVVIKTYDIADLVRPVRDYPLPEVTAAKSAGAKRAVTFTGGNAANGGNGGTASVEDEMLDHCQAMIKAVVGAGTWKEEGGTIGSMRPAPSKTSLVISQTNAAHEQIAALLTQLREQSSTRHMVRVRAWWKVLDPKEVEELQALPAGAAEDKNRDQFFDAAATYRQAQLTCYNGQTVGIQSGSETSYVSDLSPVVGTNAVGYDTTIDTAFSGVRLQVTPQLIPGGTDAVLDLQSVVSDTTFTTSPVAATTAGPATRPSVEHRAADGVGDGTKIEEVKIDGPADVGPGSATNAIAFIQRPQVSDQSFNTTVRVRLGRSTIVSGITMPPESKDKTLLLKEVDFKGKLTVAETKPRTLYLIVRVDAVQ